MSLKYWQGPEWSAWILEQAAEDTLAKVRMYNADADIWRLLRPEDFGANVQTPVGVATVPFPINQIAEKQYTYNVILAAGVSNIIIQFVVPAGLGITFMGFWITTHLGQGCVYEIDVNRVKRQEAPIRGMKGKNYAFDDSGIIPVGTTGFYHVNAILLEQFVFVRQNDLVQIQLYVKHAFTGQIEFFPIAVIAGNRKQLLVAE